MCFVGVVVEVRFLIATVKGAVTLLFGEIEFSATCPKFKRNPSGGSDHHTHT